MNSSAWDLRLRSAVGFEAISMAFSTYVDESLCGSFPPRSWGSGYLSFHLRTLAAGARDEQQDLSWVQLLSSGPSTRMMCRPRVGSGFMLSIHLDVGLAAAVTGRQQGSNTFEGGSLFSMPEMCGSGGLLDVVPHYWWLESLLRLRLGDCKWWNLNALLFWHAT